MATLVTTERIKNWRGRVIGQIDIYSNGDKTVKDFYGRIKGRYVKNSNVTTDFYGRRIAQGDQCGLLLSAEG